jgi:hypothetical protein
MQHLLDTGRSALRPGWPNGKRAGTSISAASNNDLGRQAPSTQRLM